MTAVFLGNVLSRVVAALEYVICGDLLTAEGLLEDLERDLRDQLREVDG